MRTRKHILPTVAAAVCLGAMALSACTTKSCRCYLLERWGNVFIGETYTTPGTECSELGYSTMNPEDSTYRYCTDMDEALYDTIEIVRMFWD